MAERKDAFQEISEHLSKTQSLLDAETTKLKSDREKMERDFSVLRKFTSKPIKLDIGGQVFMISLATVRRDPNSMLASMFSGRFDAKLEDDGSYFIDRDPKHFRHILNYLRTEEVVLPKGDDKRREILLEAQFYNIQAVIKLLNRSFNSSVLTRENERVLLSWLHTDGIACDGWSCIYKETRDGFEEAMFHRLCDNKGPRTISIVETTQGYVFGGYTDIAWNSQTEWGQYESSKTFIFALQSHGLRSESYRAFPKDDKHYYTVCHNPSYLFTFGGGCDLCIADESNSASGSYSNWGHTYDRPSSTTSNEWLNGQKNFQTEEIEVFAL